MCNANKKCFRPACMLEDLVNEIKESPYSLIVDESTDASTEKVLCIMIRYFSFKKKKFFTTFYRLVKISDATANGIYSALKQQLEADGLPLKNLVGIEVDSANVNVGANHSVSTLLREDLPDIIVIKCICHSLHLCAKKAAELLPRQLEYLIRETHNWFSHSPKRKDEYKEIYNIINNGTGNPKKIAGLSGTRWLARYSAIDTILSQWDELKLLFELSKSKEKCLTAQHLYKIISCPAFKLFLVFLYSNLKLLTNLNKLFQSNDIEMFKLLDDLFFLYKSILQQIVVPS
ncbi:GSCOCG00010903001-RA-CDS, partial [Cotesia congregata]